MAEHLAENLSYRIGDRITQGERMGERTGEQLGDRIDERISHVERFGEQLAQGVGFGQVVFGAVGALGVGRAIEGGFSRGVGVVRKTRYMSYFHGFDPKSPIDELRS